MSDQDAEALGDKKASGIVFLKSFKDYYYGYETKDGKQKPVYVDMIGELTEKYPLSQPQIIREHNQKDFIALFVLSCLCGTYWFLSMILRISISYQNVIYRIISADINIWLMSGRINVKTMKARISMMTWYSRLN